MSPERLHPCKHLDYETNYGPDIQLVTLEDYSLAYFHGVKYWHRGKRWTDNGPGEKPNPAKVQFCKLRGRINEVFACYAAPGPMNCYEPLESENTK